MKLTKEDLMRLPKERLAEIIVEMQDETKIEYIPIPSPSLPNISPWNPNSPFGPTVTYATSSTDPVVRDPFDGLREGSENN